MLRVGRDLASRTRGLPVPHRATLMAMALVIATSLSSLANVTHAAATLTVGSNIEFSNGQAPASATKPWVEMVITDVSPGVVHFTLTAPNLTASENVSEFNFNLDPALALGLGNLTFTNLIKTGSFDTPSIDQLANGFKADGDGFFDIQLAFTTGGNLTKTFNRGDSLQYTISGSGISAESFNFPSTPGGGNGTYMTASHVQNTTGVGNGGSGWVSDPAGGSIHLINVPEPSALVLAALGAIAFATLRFRKRE